jgi:NH3-dependent NAD+ synthetase
MQEPAYTQRPTLTVLSGGRDSDVLCDVEADALRSSERLRAALEPGDPLYEPLGVFCRLLRVRAVQTGLLRPVAS